MEGIGMGVAAVKGALETQADLATRVIHQGVSASSGLAAAQSGAELRTTAMQERGVGQQLNVSV